MQAHWTPESRMLAIDSGDSWSGLAGGVARTIHLVSVALTIVASMTGCTLLSDFDVHQCELAEDCRLWDEGSSHCENGRCVPGCLSNADCASRDPSRPICTEPGGSCVELTMASDDCYASCGYDEGRAGALTADDMVIVGAFGPTVRSSAWLTIALASSELDVMGGLPGADRSQPLVTLLCHDGEQLDAALHHLVNHLGAKAVIATLEDTDLRAALDRAPAAQRAAFISPNGAHGVSDASAEVSPWLRYWGSRYDGALPLYRAAVQAISAASGVEPGAYRIALVVSEAREDVDLADAVREAIDVGGLPGEELARQGRLQRYSLAQLDALSIAADIAAKPPDLLLLFAGGPSRESPYPERSSIIAEIEDRIASVGRRAPSYVLGPRNLYDRSPALRAMKDTSFRGRTLVLSTDRTPVSPLAEVLESSFSQAFPALDPALAGAPAFNVYDVYYLIAHASLAASMRGFRDPEGLLAGLSLVSDGEGEPLDIGPAGIGLAAADHRALDLIGTSGPASFAADGTRPGEPRAYCWSAAGRPVPVRILDTVEQRLMPVAADCGGTALGE
jgi:hypothetical protein